MLGTVILAFALFGWRRLFYLAFAALVIVSGFFVNPVVEGTGAIFEKHWQKKSKKSINKILVKFGCLKMNYITSPQHWE